jgi:hypothetical protein
VPPLFDFPRENGICAIIGGVVMRDSSIPALAGRYVYGDFCSGKLTVVAIDAAGVVGSTALEVTVPALTGFGVDAARRVYATSANGGVFRLDPAPSG